MTISKGSWSRGRDWALFRSHVRNIRSVALPGGWVKLYGEVLNSSGKYQTATAEVSDDGLKFRAMDGGTILEDGEHVPFTYHAAALIMRWKWNRETPVPPSFRVIMAQGYTGD